jgi:hypothetical protein
MSNLFVVDVEADGPAPGLYSMVNFGVVEVTESGAGRHFYGECAPIVDDYIPEALAVSGFTRAQHEAFAPAQETMTRLVKWLAESGEGGRPVFVSDNPAFDWQFINYYLWRFTGGNPFGHSARRIGDFYAGLQQNFRARPDWKKLRVTKHTHNPVDDARGNAEALAKLIASTKQKR